MAVGTPPVWRSSKRIPCLFSSSVFQNIFHCFNAKTPKMCFLMCDWSGGKSRKLQAAFGSVSLHPAGHVNVQLGLCPERAAVTVLITRSTKQQKTAAFIFKTYKLSCVMWPKLERLSCKSHVQTV